MFGNRRACDAIARVYAERPELTGDILKRLDDEVAVSLPDGTTPRNEIAPPRMLKRFQELLAGCGDTKPKCAVRRLDRPFGDPHFDSVTHPRHHVEHER